MKASIILVLVAAIAGCSGDRVVRNIDEDVYSLAGCPLVAPKSGGYTLAHRRASRANVIMSDLWVCRDIKWRPPHKRYKRRVTCKNPEYKEFCPVGN